MLKYIFFCAILPEDICSSAALLYASGAQNIFFSHPVYACM